MFAVVVSVVSVVCSFFVDSVVALVDDEDEVLSLSGFFTQDASAVSITATRISRKNSLIFSPKSIKILFFISVLVICQKIPPALAFDVDFLPS